jgi:phenylpyruvate tautomerase PptA (4-oxalocrotonate tautomerase family)
VAVGLYGRRRSLPAGSREKTVPIYQCSSPAGLLDESVRARLAEEITRIHCDATGVPPSYVNVIFTDVPDGHYFVAGKPAAHSLLSAAIRAGHDVTVRQSILENLSQTWSRLTSQPEEELIISLWENKAENAMEGGSIFPAVGDE